MAEMNMDLLLLILEQNMMNTQKAHQLIVRASQNGIVMTYH